MALLRERERERGELGRGPCMFHSLAVSCSRVSGEDKVVFAVER